MFGLGVLVRFGVLVVALVSVSPVSAMSHPDCRDGSETPCVCVEHIGPGEDTQPRHRCINYQPLSAFQTPLGLPVLTIPEGLQLGGVIAALLGTAFGLRVVLRLFNST